MSSISEANCRTLVRHASKSLYNFESSANSATSKSGGMMFELFGEAAIEIYQRTVKPERARCRLENWVNSARAKCERFGECLALLAKVADTIEKRLEGIRAHWTNGRLSTGFLEGLNSVFTDVNTKGVRLPQQGMQARTSARWRSNPSAPGQNNSARCRGRPPS